MPCLLCFLSVVQVSTTKGNADHARKTESQILRNGGEKARMEVTVKPEFDPVVMMSVGRLLYL